MEQYLERIWEVLGRLLAANSDENGDGEYAIVLADIKQELIDLNTALLASQDSILDYYFIAGEVGTIPAGYNKVSFFNDGDTDVLVNGVILPSGIGKDYVAKSIQNTLPAISYDVQLSKLIISGVQ